MDMRQEFQSISLFLLKKTNNAGLSKAEPCSGLNLAQVSYEEGMVVLRTLVDKAHLEEMEVVSIRDSHYEESPTREAVMLREELRGQKIEESIAQLIEELEKILQKERKEKPWTIQ